MCHQRSLPCVTVEEDITAEECLLVYCKPVELYNILKRHAQQNPSFLPRCLNYKIEAKWKTRLTHGNVIFNYRDQNNLLRKTEVTRQFTCPFCLMKCGSFQGLHSHLITLHDLFKCDLWTEEYRAINVSVKTDALHSESNAEEIEPQLQSYGFCSRPRKRKCPEDPLEKGKYVYTHVLESPSMATERQKGGKDHSLCPMADNLITGEYCYSQENGYANGMDYSAANNNVGVLVARAQSLEDIDCAQSASADKNISATLHPAAKSKKLSSERTEPRSTTLLQKRQFYHSHKPQPMALEQVFSDRDSEDEVDDEIADLEDRKMLDDFVDVTKDEKHLMHLWNSFVRKQRVLADGHVSWDCEAFLRLHGKMLVQSPTLFWCWRLFMVKLWNHGLLDACTMNSCNVILEQHRD